MKKIIYYFSGTGNSLRAAHIIAKQLKDVELVSMRNKPEAYPASDANIIGFICPVYEWDIPGAAKKFIEKLSVNPNAYFFMVATCVAINGRCFETVEALLNQKHSKLNYGHVLHCVASQCTAYDPFPSEKFMIPRSERKTLQIAKEITAKKNRRYPRMSPITRALYPKLMTPYMNVEHEYDKGFYTSDACISCGICQKVCPCDNITFEDKRPSWNHNCHGCNACVAYCPNKAIQFKTPEAYVQLGTPISKKLGLPEKRKRYHNPFISAKDMMKASEHIE